MPQMATLSSALRVRRSLNTHAADVRSLAKVVSRATSILSERLRKAELDGF